MGFEAIKTEPKLSWQKEVGVWNIRYTLNLPFVSEKKFGVLHFIRCLINLISEAVSSFSVISLELHVHEFLIIAC